MSETRKKKEIWQDSELFDKEHQTKPDCQAVAVQISPDYKEVAVQTHGEVTGTASETTGKAKYIMYNYCTVASFPGPAQLSVVLQATESWVGPGNKANCTVQVLPDTNIMFIYIYNYMDLFNVVHRLTYL